MATVKSLCEVARQDLKQGRYKEAEIVVKHILVHYPKSVEAHRLLGEIYAESGRVESAGRVFKLVLSADPEDFLAHVGLGVSIRDQGGLHDAIFEFERALELQPNNAELRKEILRLRALRDGSQASRVKPTKATLARIHLKDGRYERARREFAAVMADDKTRLDVAVGLIQALWRAGRGAEAGEECRKILELAPDCVKAQLILGDYYVQEGRLVEGHRYLESAHALDPDGIVAASLFEGQLPEVYVELGLSDVPEEIAGMGGDSRLLGVGSANLTVTGGGARPNADWRTGKGRDTGALGGEVGQVYQPSTVTARLRDISGVTARLSGRLGGAGSAAGGTRDLSQIPVVGESNAHMIEVARRTLAADPSNHLCRLDMADLLVAENEVDKALAELSILLTSAPDLLDEVVEELQRLLGREPQNAELRRLLGDAYTKQGRFQEAIEILGQGLEKS